jgi:hypothetical protein
MKINEALWDKVKKAIESGTKKDSSITDITIKFRIVENAKQRNYIQFNLSQYEH